MATTVTATVKSAAGDYSSLSAWEAGVQGDLVAADEIREADCYDFQDTTLVDIDGSTTDSTRYLRIKSNVNHGGTWNTSAYRLEPTTFQPSLTIQDDFTQVLGIQIGVIGLTTYAPQGIRVVTVGGVRIERCVVRSTYSGTNDSAINRGIDAGLGVGVTFFASNNVVYGFSAAEAVGTSVGIFTGDATAYLYNNTVVGCLRGIAESGGNTCRAKNNLCSGNTTADFSSGFTSSNNNASSDATAPGTSSRTTQTFTFVGGSDYHLQSSDAGAKGYGVDLSGDGSYAITVDVDNVTRSGSWDIGADQTALTGGHKLAGKLGGKLSGKV